MRVSSRFADVRGRNLAARLLIQLALVASPIGLFAQGATNTAADFAGLAWDADFSASARFVSVHGRRAALFGNSQDGLEFWSYPFQIVRSFKVGFRSEGTTTEIDGGTILRRIVYRPESVTRIYSGPDFIVKEKIFVPLDEPGAIIRYDVFSRHPVEIVVHFLPVLDLMWPGGIGGQEAIWNSKASAYFLSEPKHRFSGIIGSPDIVEHDETRNQNRRAGREQGLAFTLRAADETHSARIIIAGGPEQSAASIAEKLLEHEGSLITLAVDHYSTLLNSALQIQTPDERVNRALLWSEIALDQAWVCNPDLGCGLVAGYGPSRNARRPQYDWFFAGDGMVDIPALLAAGEFERARHELEFILQYQDEKSGMIWHELAQSASWLDWKSYPYMFVHVELTFDFLTAVANYFAATGDRAFLQSHWPAIESAYAYCRSLIDPRDRLPHIPPEKEGSREQDPLSEELALSASWIAALQSYAELAAATGHDAAATEASSVKQQTTTVIRNKYWDDGENFWITGYTRSGQPLLDRDIGPVSVLDTNLFSETQRDAILDQLATSDFRTDWGLRGRAASSRTYDPNSYANGSVWATSTSRAAVAFWAAHRPTIAFSVWQALVLWGSLDSLGHMHETLAGDYFHEEFESVPEQTWSSATFFEAAVKGWLGLQKDAVSNRLVLTPHLPPSWDKITIRNLSIGASEVNFKLINSPGKIRLEMQNKGAPMKISFAPEIPLGAKVGQARLQNQSIAATLEKHSQDSHVRVEFTLPHDNVVLTIEYAGGVALQPELPPVMIGDESRAVEITKVNLREGVYTLDFDYLASAGASFEMHTPWRIENVRGATIEALSHDWYRLRVAVPPREKAKHTYEHGEVQVIFRPL